ncbi:MAG: LCP family protein, partial [Erysipelotrichaceae bacterium]|nr:LCP family protein [Erysipelotrichaceae bacterium]
MANMKKTSSKKFTGNTVPVNIALAVIIALIDLGIIFLMTSLTQFSNFSKLVFILINVLILILLLTINILFIISIKSRKKSIFNTTVILVVVFSLLSGYGSYASLKLNRNVNKIVTTGEQQEVVEAAIVAKQGVTAVSELDGKTVGIMAGAKYTDIGKSNIESVVTSVDYSEYTDLNSLFTALVADEVDAAIMPSNYVGIFEVVAGYEEALESLSTVETFKDTVTVSVDKSEKDITSEPISILVLGVDEGRSDANMLVTFNPISLTITMTSIARDSYVPIACYAGQASDKLGHARVQGIQCTIDTIENLLDVEIDYYFESNFQGVVDIVDALGGIVINNPYEFVGQNSSDERGHYTVWIPAGENVPVNGEQALAFARERHLYATGDFQRQANQQQVVTSILTTAMRTRDLNKLLNVLDAAGDNITTNITVDQFIDLFNYVMKKTSRIYNQENIESVFNIVGSRVTGYNSSVWSESAQLALSIVRPYEGSIEDNHNAITRNLDLNSEITAPKSFKWDANWEFYAPTISNETYSEQIIQSETPQSYWCTKTGGTWNGSACACPAGEFVENKGCIQDSASNYADAATCQGAGFIWDESTNACVTVCPQGTTSDGKYCRATKADPSTFTNETDCIANGNKWDPTNNACYATCPSGTDDNDGDGKCAATVTEKKPSDYQDSNGCVAAGFKWDKVKGTCDYSCPSGTVDNNGICEAAPTDPNQKLCTDTGGTWNNGACSCPADKPNWDGNQGCYAAAKPKPDPGQCGASGGTWDGNSGTCTCPGGTTTDGTTACPTVPKPDPGQCGASGGTWDGNSGICTCPGGTTTDGTTACPAVPKPDPG